MAEPHCPYAAHGGRRIQRRRFHVDRLRPEADPALDVGRRFAIERVHCGDLHRPDGNAQARRGGDQRRRKSRVGHRLGGDGIRAARAIGNETTFRDDLGALWQGIHEGASHAESDDPPHAKRGEFLDENGRLRSAPQAVRHEHNAAVGKLRLVNDRSIERDLKAVEHLAL